MTKKTYEEFCTYVEETIPDRIPMDREAVARVKEVRKNNDIILKGLTIMSGGKSLSPMLYLEPYYEQYVQGFATLEATITQIADTYSRLHAQNPSSFDIQMLRKESVIGSLINIHYNRDFIKDVPFIPVGEDFAVIFKYYLNGTTDSSATITITDSLAELMGLEESMLLKLALQNTPRIYPLEFSPLTEMVNRLIQKGDLCSEFPDASDLSDAENEVPLHVLTNTRNEFGAFAFFYPETAKTLFDTLKDDLILIPSSVSEWIIMPYSQAGIAPFLESMIQEVNHEHVAPQEILGDRAYFLKRDSRDIFQQLIPLSEAC